MLNRKHFPIVMAHINNPPYLEYCLRQIRKFNPDNPIYLIGDESNDCFDFVEHRNITDPVFSVDIDRFRAIYQHYSPLSFQWERFCFERWLYIRNFLRAENLSGCLAIDTDVLLFCDVDEEAERFKEYAMTFAHWDNNCNLVHCNFLQSRFALDSFCDYMFQVYEDPTILERIKKKIGMKYGRYWISDMSLFGDWSRQTKEKISFYEDFYSQGIYFDRCIDNCKHFRCQFYFPGLKKFKKVFFLKGHPYGQLKDGQTVPFKCLHYHGFFKFLMKDHFNGKHSHWKTFLLLFMRSILLIPRKLTNFVKRILYRLRHFKLK
ncbi:MAG: hypothetical protein Q4C95_03465 [Planctomycetia bacterium]|nr:hypothetical protein [Planctomycetia bacterium]